MQKIHLLEESVINKIAAGEVIERPASVVKELMENAIDAGATTITIEAEEGGKSSIKLTDDGCGMSTEDALLCFQRHATSKINTAEDLFSITTLGFRGEGLASIAAVADIVLKTKPKQQDVGTKIAICAGKILKSEAIAMPDGTNIEVTDLFFSVPARKKHLKTMQTELRQIVEVVTRYVLAYPEKTFRFVHQKQDIIFVSATEHLQDTILALYGRKIAYSMLPVEYQENTIGVHGFIGKPALSRADKTLQHLFVNKRPVRNPVIAKAVNDAYHTLLHLDRQPVFVLHITLPPTIIDINAHPQKTTIRIEREQELYAAVFAAVRKGLEGMCLATVAEEKQKVIHAPLLAKQVIMHEEKQSIFVKEASTPSAQLLSPQQILERAMEKIEAQHTIQPAKQNAQEEQQTKTSVTILPSEVPGTERISSLRLLGCIHRLFYIAENEYGLVIIDQHAAHERVLYEQFMQQFMTKGIAVQELLVPEQIEFSPAELLLLEEQKEILLQFGFFFEAFGGRTMLLRSVPAVLGKIINKDVVHDILAQLDEKTTALDHFKEEKLIRSACRAAVKAQDVVHEEEMKQIVLQLQQCKQPFTCPHGRPTMIQMSVPELEKKFKRVV